MTAKAKARELFDKYDSFLYKKYNNLEAKKCALISVDEIIEQIKKVIDEAPNIHQSLCTNKKLCIDVLNPTLKYWQEVKQEIKNI